MYGVMIQGVGSRIGSGYRIHNAWLSSMLEGMAQFHYKCF